MKSETQTEPMPREQAKKETNQLVKNTKQEIRTIASRTTYDTIDILEIFVGELLRRTGILKVRN
jgi:hypothetical protein